MKLSEIFGSEQRVVYPHTTFETRSLSTMQLAMSIVVGYRARDRLARHAGRRLT
jgi:hypothetical protein